MGIETENMMFDIKIAAYLLNSSQSKYLLADLASDYLGLENPVEQEKSQKKQMSLFEELEEDYSEDYFSTYAIGKLYPVLCQKMKESETWSLFETIEMPLAPVLAQMQYNGMYIDQEELKTYGKELQAKIQELTQEIYQLSGCTFNVNSTKQLGEVLFEKLKLPVYKKTKSGYSTDVEILEKLREEHPIIEKILEYRQLNKLNSTYVEGMLPYINPVTHRIHSYFHQTVTTTGRISSTEPNMQNIPTRFEAGKMLRKVFKAENDNVFLDADYSQIELRIFAHISNDPEMISAFQQDEDIHAQVAAKVFHMDIKDVTPALRSKAKAVNFGIVYGISDFGLSQQLGVPRKEAKAYIDEYLKKYSGIREFMEKIPEKAKEDGYVETLFKRRRYIPELHSKNYNVRQFGIRAAMNTPIQGTAADIIKLAMIHVEQALKEQNLKSKLVLQVHDELMIETVPEEKEKIQEILKECMENVIQLSVPLKVEIGEGKNWYESK